MLQKANRINIKHYSVILLTNMPVIAELFAKYSTNEELATKARDFELILILHDVDANWYWEAKQILVCKYISLAVSRSTACVYIQCGI